MNNTGKHTSLREVGEFGLIQRLSALLPELPVPEIVGPGDDCAVVPSGHLFPGTEGSWELITSDVLVEGCHFRLDYSSPFAVGWKSLAVSLSDIAAMGGVPKVAVVNLQLRDDLSLEMLEELYRGIAQAALQHGVLVLGGDTVRAKELAVSFTLLGTTLNKPILRSGARVGEHVWISGAIGGAGAGLLLLEGALDKVLFEDEGASVLERYRMPMPRVLLGKQLSEQGLACSMIDVSDGLIQDVQHVAEKSEVQILLELERIPYEQGLLGRGAAELMSLTAGDDYELVFTAAPEVEARLEVLSESLVNGERIPKLSRIGATRGWEGTQEGVLVKDRNGDIRTSSELLNQVGSDARAGYQHF